MYDKRVTLEKSHALEEIEKLELFIAQAEIKLQEMEAQIQSGTSVSFQIFGPFFNFLALIMSDSFEPFHMVHMTRMNSIFLRRKTLKVGSMKWK